MDMETLWRQHCMANGVGCATEVYGLDLMRMAGNAERRAAVHAERLLLRSKLAALKSRYPTAYAVLDEAIALIATNGKT